MPAAVTPARRLGALGRLVAVLTALAVAAVVVPSSASAQTTDDEAKQAAREIQAARDRANSAAEAFFAAQSELEALEDRSDALGRETDALERRVAALRADVERVAIARFTTSGSAGIPVLTGMQPPKDQVQAKVFLGVVSDTGLNALDEYDALRKQLESKRADLEAMRRDVEAKREEFAQLQQIAEDEVVSLRKIEEQRLTDEAVAEALAAQQAAFLAALQEQMRRDAEVNARAMPNPGLKVDEADLAPDTSILDDENPDGSPDDAGVALMPSGVPTMAVNNGASGGTSGGRTGLGGPGSTPIGVLNGEIYLDAIACPVLGSAYGDSWGAGRSGGRRHEGVDMLAPAGTPLYAVVGGEATFKQNTLGGLAVSLVGDNGNRYYYAHLSSYEGISRRVVQGEVIGYVGDTGNATGIPHLHFEIHPGGGLAVNPTNSVRIAGC